MESDEGSFRELVDDLPDLVCRISPEGTLLYVNRAYAAYFGRTVADLLGTNFLDLVPEELRHDALRDLESATSLTPTHPTRASEHRGGDLDGRQRWQHWVDKARFDDDGRMCDLLAVGRDVTERHRLEQQIHYHARHDWLTGLVNRRCTIEAIERAVAEASDDGRTIGLLYIDLDDFKFVNDRFGHRTGDRVLVDVARVLARCVRLTDAVGRLGGDEFVVLCSPIAAPEELDEITARIGERLAVMPRPMSASIGSVVFRPGESVDELLHRADQAMYVTKQLRRERRSSA